MARQPAVIIIARHGARLDAADKAWHLSSPAPYDPPLTYGGWTQSRALGTRIASLLHARETSINETGAPNGELAGNGETRSGQLEASAEARDPQAPLDGRRKHKVVIHSSPFLRCIQTAIAISAGVAEFKPRSKRPRNRSTSPRASQMHHLHSSRLGSADAHTAGLQTSELEAPLDVVRRPILTRPHEKTTLRIDAFLGEWLSPDYFELITPPPNSTMMVAGAKAELLRRGDYIEASQPASTGHFPGGWAKTGGSALGLKPLHHGESPLSNLGSLSHALPWRDRAGSQSSVGSAGSFSRRGATHLSPAHTNSLTYKAPTPSYAVSQHDPIPRGYVAHARDGCVDIDYQWDSMREPQEWGDGGSYGEEWMAMHHRFRNGLDRMIIWYREHGSSAPPNVHEAVTDSNDEGLDEDTDLVLVLVTHGAGCNALIGALTGQPMLVAVNMASLTMAVRRENAEKSAAPPAADGPSAPASSARKPALRLALPEEYEMRLISSTQHLQPGVDPAVIPEAPPQETAPREPEFRRRFPSGSFANVLEGSYSVPEPGRGVSAALGSIRRSSSTKAATGRTYSPIRAPLYTVGGSSSLRRSGSYSTTPGPVGLWSRPKTLLDGTSEGSSSDGNDFLLNFGDTNGAPESPKLPSPQVGDASGSASPGKVIGQPGLWTSAQVGDRERGAKRRWTVSQGDA